MYLHTVGALNWISQLTFGDFKLSSDILKYQKREQDRDVDLCYVHRYTTGRRAWDWEIVDDSSVRRD